MKFQCDLIEEDEDIEESDICPFMSRFETGSGNFIGYIKCIRSHCKCWNKKRNNCGMLK